MITGTSQADCAVLIAAAGVGEFEAVSPRMDRPVSIASGLHTGCETADYWLTTWIPLSSPCSQKRPEDIVKEVSTQPWVCLQVELAPHTGQKQNSQFHSHCPHLRRWLCQPHHCTCYNSGHPWRPFLSCPSSLILIFFFYFRDCVWETQKHWFVVAFIDAFTGWFLYEPNRRSNCNLGTLGQCSHLLSYSTRALISYLNFGKVCWPCTLL